MIPRGIFPDQLIIAKVRPVFLKETKNTSSCYKPISILPKIKGNWKELFITNSYNLSNYKIYKTEQHRFRWGKSVTSDGIELICKLWKVMKANPKYKQNCIIDIFDKGAKVVGVFLDHNIKGKELAWVVSYIHEWKRFVEITQYKLHNNYAYKHSNIETAGGEIQGPLATYSGTLLFLCSIKGVPGKLWGKLSGQFVYLLIGQFWQLLESVSLVCS